MTTPLIFRPIGMGEEGEVCHFVTHVFNEFIAPGYSQEGVNEFLKYVQPDSLLQRLHKNHFALLATVQNRIVGMIEIRANSHISLFFVDQPFQRRGISRELLRRALEICRKNKPDIREVSVNASPNSIPAYERLGFRPASSEQIINGIRFTPMILELPETKGS